MKAIEDCDVEDRSALKEFRHKREEWLSWIWSDEYHALQRQIVRMIHNDMAYRVLIEARRCPEDESPGAALNGLLASFMDQAYVETQVLAIGRLTDRGNDVVSVRRLVDDVHAHCYLFTREIYVAHDGVPYEPQIEGSGLLIPGSNEDKSFNAWIRHEKFDQISGISPAGRSRSNCIQCHVFKAVEDCMREIEEEGLRKLRNKFVAHAASTTSRGSQRYSGPSPEILEKVAKAHRQIVRAFTAIAGLLRAERLDLAVYPPLGFLNGLDNAYSTVPVAGLQKRWDELRQERETWLE